MPFKNILISVIILLSVQFLFSQSTTFNIPGNDACRFLSSGEKVILKENKPGHTYTIITKDGKAQLYDNDQTEEINIIVEFKEEPLFINQKQKTIGNPSINLYTNQFSTFSNDIININNKFSQQIKVDLKLPEITRTFYKVFNGVSMTVSKGIINSIQELDYVKKIHLNKKYKTTLKESVPLIKADSVWLQYGTEGDSIIIGVIDTGIDYMHPALGGGFGKGFKVIGGYDIVNKDNDPIDDEGHGTHVAGIIAGNGGEIKGVAPKALLMAFKVLNSYGSGTEDQILEGIERASDPNGDGKNDDKVDIANMSLGGDGDPYDALSTAVDNAVRTGIIFCISAGNNGSTGYNTIGSPGTAELAITVGASDKDDKIAFFSSKGPNTKTYSIKPDIVAPGVNIYSSVLNGEYDSFDGTSMAAPHIAGVCALLKKIHPGWSPAEIKSAIMISAKDIGYGVPMQGAGRVDALEAASITTLALPSHLSFGLEDMDIPLWSKKDTLSIKNTSSVSQVYNINIEAEVPGINILANPKIFTLLPGNSQLVEFTMQLDNNIVPVEIDSLKTGSSFTYSGNVFVNGTVDNFHIPWSVVKAAKLFMFFDKPNIDFYMASSRQFYYNMLLNFQNPYELLVEPGNYDIISYFSDNNFSRIVVKENLYLGNNDTLNINSESANNAIIFNAKNDLGGNVDLEYLLCRFNFPDSIGGSITFGAPYQYIQASNFSERISFSAGGIAYSKGENKIWKLDFGKHYGFDKPLTMSNDFSKFVLQKINYKIQPFIEAPYVYPAFGPLILLDDGGIWLSFSFSDFSLNGRECTANYYLVNENDGNEIAIESGLGFVSGSRSPSEYYTYCHTPPLSVYNDSVGFFFPKIPKKDVFLDKIGDDIDFNNGLILASNFHPNNYYGKSNIFVNAGFYGNMGEDIFYHFMFSKFKILTEDNKLVLEDIIENSSPVNVPPGKYRTEITSSNIYVEGEKGKVKTTSNFDLSSNDPIPPYIYSVQVRNSKGAPASRLDKGESGKLMIAAYDPIIKGEILSLDPLFDDSTAVYVREYKTENWNKLNVLKISQDTLIGGYYSADFSGYTDYDSSALDFKLVLYDKSGNNAEYVIEPGIALGKFAGLVTNTDENEETSAIPKEYSLEQNFPNPFNPSTKIRYEIPIEGEIIIKVFDILGREITTLVNENKKAGKYEVEWHGDNYASGIYFYSIRAANFSSTRKFLLLK